MRKKVLHDLSKWGCDIEHALERFDDDWQMYKECLVYVSEDKSLYLLGQAIEQGNIQDAFVYSHTLKGVYANLGLTPMLNVNIRILEPLRVGKTDGIAEAYKELLNTNDILREILFMDQEN